MFIISIQRTLIFACNLTKTLPLHTIAVGECVSMLCAVLALLYEGKAMKGQGLTILAVKMEHNGLSQLSVC